jgi:hypothetical protein
MRALALLTLFVMPTAFAGVVYTSGDWELDDTSTRSNPNGTCIARTLGGDDRVDMALELRIPKNKPAALEMYLTQEYGRVKAWNVVLRDDTVFLAAPIRRVRTRPERRVCFYRDFWWAAQGSNL